MIMVLLICSNVLITLYCGQRCCLIHPYEREPYPQAVIREGLEIRCPRLWSRPSHASVGALSWESYLPITRWQCCGASLEKIALDYKCLVKSEPTLLSELLSMANRKAMATSGFMYVAHVCSRRMYTLLVTTSTLGYWGSGIGCVLCCNNCRCIGSMLFCSSSNCSPTAITTECCEHFYLQFSHASWVTPHWLLAWVMCVLVCLVGLARPR